MIARITNGIVITGIGVPGMFALARSVHTSGKSVIAVVPSSPTAMPRNSASVPIADVAPTHLSYPAVSVSVASGIMGLEGGAFGLLEPVTGAQAVDVINRLEALTR